MHAFILLNEDPMLLVTLTHEIHLVSKKRENNIEEYVMASKLFS